MTSRRAQFKLESAAYNVLFGILALQKEFITRDQLVAAIIQWQQDQSKTIREILSSHKHLTVERSQLLSALVDQESGRSDSSPTMSLTPEESRGSTRDDLARSDDANRPGNAVVAATERQESSESTATPTTVGDGTSLGRRFRILRPHDKGGLGQISIALDQELNREVALKEIQARYADNPESRARFLLEAEVTGRLEHPGVVPVYGLGADANGRPFYAMRFIRGENFQRAIKQFHKSGGTFDSLEIRQLVSRFIDVCNTVAYAHSRKILHRDLKPANIMLGKYGETLVVDWGLAKVQASRERQPLHEEPAITPMAHSGTEETLPGSAVGTPQYMSPEQAVGRWDAIGPATDVYSLGATLYEILTGKPSVSEGYLHEMLRRVERGEIVSAQIVNPAAPRALVAVCQKAMALDPEERYSSALEVAKEIERWLADEPVAALKETRKVRARRWMRRHPGAVAGIAASLIVGVVGLGSLLYFVNAERSRTELARQGEERQRLEAEARQSETEAVLNFVEDRVFAAATPQNLGREVKLADAVRNALPQIATGFADKPVIEARVRLSVGRSFWFLGEPDQAEKQFGRARELFNDHLGPDHPDTLRSMSNLANAYSDLGQLQKALDLADETYQRQRARLGPDHPDTMGSMSNLAVCYWDFGRHAEALKLFERALELRAARLGPDHQDTLASMNNLALGYATLDRFTEALALHEKTFALRKAKLGPLHPDTLASMTNIALSNVGLGRHREALVLREEALRLHKEKLGVDHADTIACMANLAESYVALNRMDDALRLTDDALRQALAKPGVHPLLVRVLLDGRLRAFSKKGDAAGCRASAETWEKFIPRDADSQYQAACFRAVCAQVMRERAESNADEQADRAMDWLRQAIAKGYKNIEHMKNDRDLDSLRDRADFKKLLAELATHKAP